jgi:hypothetical protein
VSKKDQYRGLTPFKKGFDPKRNVSGAPRKLISKISELGYNNREIADTLMNIAALTKAEIQSITENEECTLLERMVAKALLKDYEKGSLWNLETIISRAVGKPKESATVENSGKIEVVFVEGKTIL